jgi:hypothetical protein
VNPADLRCWGKLRCIQPGASDILHLTRNAHWLYSPPSGFTGNPHSSNAASRYVDFCIAHCGVTTIFVKTISWVRINIDSRQEDEESASGDYSMKHPRLRRTLYKYACRLAIMCIANLSRIHPLLPPENPNACIYTHVSLQTELRSTL